MHTKEYKRLSNYKYSVLESELAKAKVKIRELDKRRLTILQIMKERRDAREDV